LFVVRASNLTKMWTLQQQQRQISEVQHHDLEIRKI
jgi:hypothetical protein